MKKEKRDSNFELLRIISIILVIISHFNCHTNITINSINDFNINYALSSIFTTGCIANLIFILITGYFMVKSKPNYKKILGLIFDMLFYSIIIFIVFASLGLTEITGKNIIKCMLPMLYGNWFCIYYIILYLFIPVLNYILNNLSKEKIQKLILLLTILISIIPTFTNALGFTKHDVLILAYMIGGYIRLYVTKPINKKKVYAITIIDILILITSVISMCGLGIVLKQPKLIAMSNHFIATNDSIFVIILAICIFLIFKDTKIKYNKTINTIASSVLGIYLIHENEHIKNIIWEGILPNSSFYTTGYFFLIGICKIIIVFIICLIIDQIKNIILKQPKEKIINILYKQIENIHNKVEKILVKI